MKRLCILALAALLPPAAALAWGSTGHRIVGAAAVQALPVELPAFLRSSHAADKVGELSREPDRAKGSGRVHDADRDPGHFIDLDEEAKVLGDPRGPAFTTDRLAAGPGELRDQIERAWRASVDRSVGRRPVAVRDGIAGKTNPYPSLLGIDLRGVFAPVRMSGYLPPSHRSLDDL